MTPERLAHLVEIVDRWERAERMIGGSAGPLASAARELADEARRVRALAAQWERTSEDPTFPYGVVGGALLDRCAREVLGGR